MDVAVQRVIRQILAVSLLVAAGITTGPASGQDSAQNQPFIPEYPSSDATGHADNGFVTGVFERRWEAATDEYVLDPDGVLARHNATAQSSPARKHLGIFDSLSVDAAISGNDINTDISLNGNTEIPLSNSPGPVDANVSECGPSPVEPAGIKALVEEAANRHGVDPGFAVAIVATESDFDRDRNSPKGARGPMQLMPATATRFDVDDVCDPAANIDGGVRYLRTLLDEFGNPLLVAAAYNAGEQRIYEFGGIPPFTETVSYVAKVVNHQLGLPMPSAKKAGTPRVADDGTREVGVIAPRKTGSFVAGVMHF